jgi:hypothetical protein
VRGRFGLKAETGTAKRALVTLLCAFLRRGDGGPPVTPDAVVRDRVAPFLSPGDWPFDRAYRAAHGPASPQRGHGGAVVMPDKTIARIVRAFYWCATEGEWTTIARHLALRVLSARLENTWYVGSALFCGITPPFAARIACARISVTRASRLFPAQDDAQLEISACSVEARRYRAHACGRRAPNVTGSRASLKPVDSAEFYEEVSWL